MERKRQDGSGMVNDEHSKRPRLEESQCAVNSAYTSEAFKKEIRAAWQERRFHTDDSSGAELLSEPFQCCILPSFIHDPTITACEVSKVGGAGFLQQLKEELLRLKFYKKNNDLYQFHQSDDLKKFKSPCITALRSLFHDAYLPLLKSVTGIELTDTIDMTCSKYEYTDVLLCHDDELEGRRIAFIFYLVPEWTKEDGGALDLFDTDEHGQPKDVVRSLLPVWNSFIFFDVNAVSFHQVAEVVSSTKTRLSVNGWFHGPPAPRPHPYKEPLLPMHPPLPLDLGVLSEWINPTYLDIGVQSQIQLQFEAESQIELPDFLLEERYQQLCKEVQNSKHSDWLIKGPPNKRHVHIAITESLSSATKSFMELVQSEPFCRLLAHMTGLDLAHNVIRPDLSTELKHSDSESDEGGCSTKEDNPTNLVGIENQHNGLSPSEDDSEKNGKNCPLASTDSKNSAAAAVCCCDLYSWHPGDYTLAGDESDPGYGVFCLDTMLNLSCEGWNIDQGGVTSYIAKDEDEELLSVSPSSNALSFVYRDEDSLRFTKYINHRAVLADSSIGTNHGSGNSSSLYSFIMLYKEV